MPITDPFYTREELLQFGFRSVGKDVSVSRLCQFYGVSGHIGDKVRLDDFCILKGHVEFGSFIHLAAFCLVSGVAGKIVFEDFTCLAARVSVYTGSDHYGVNRLTNATVPKKYRTDVEGPVTLRRGALIGAHAVIMPGVTIGAFATVGALGIVYKDIADGQVCVSSPQARLVVKKTKDIALLHQQADQVMAEYKA